MAKNMQITQVYLIRHGQSQGNARCAFLGHTDLDLTEFGVLQAEKTAEFLKEIPVDKIYASDLLRAYHTALPTAKMRGMKVHTDPAFREIFAGEWENMTFSSLMTDYPQSFGLWRENIGRARPDGGESVAQLKERLTGRIQALVQENLGKTLFIFTHATPIRVLKTVWDGLDLEEMKSIPFVPNASVTRAEYSDGFFRVTDYGLASFLGDMSTSLPPNAV